jgi:hypothetical protein
MIIKRYDGDNFVELFPKTKAQQVFDNAGTTAVFDSYNKLKPAYLPDSVFDSLYFYGTAATSISSNLSHYLAEGIDNAYNLNRSILGYYWVVSTAGTFNAQSNAGTININTGLVNASSGSNELTLTAGYNTNKLRVGMIVFGTNIPANATITSIKNSTTFVISAPVTGPLTSSSVIFRHVITTIFSSAEENHTYTRVFTLEDGSDNADGSTAHLQVGMRVSGTGIPNGTTITEIDGNDRLTLSQDATADGNQTLTFIPSSVTTQSTQTLEPGDWFIVTKQTGAGIAGNPFVFTIAPVNNTYELMKAASSSSAGAPGIVPAPVAGQQAHFLRGDGTWVIPTNTTYAGSTSITLAAGNSFQRAALTGDVTASANNNSTTIANDVVTFAKMQNIAANTIVGRVTAETGDATALTAAQVRTLLNVEDGANDYVHPNHSGDVTSDADGATTIGEGKVLAGMIASDAVETAKIKDLNVTTDKLAAGAVATAKIANGAVTADKIGSSEVTEAKIAAGAVATAKIADLAVSSGKIADSAVATAKIADLAVSTAKIAAGAVTDAKIGTNAVTEIKINTGAVTAAKIGSGAVTEVKIGSGAVTEAKIGSNAVTTVKINNGAVTNAKLADMAGFTIKGKNTTGAGDPLDLTTSQVRTLTNTVALFFQSTAPTVHADGVALQTGTLWFDTAA